ncbi:hypothetical protein KQI86_04640 [Clostridium sp. MSJ-11]|uniref:Uncharacterized protein n=1 Tax=Clostridium mobile TaxID=2841512 RepID=A0ABS6EEH0_9CLOT|nr:hypothetical protein [Clostridium mobile]MBU5483606.1 hypothetical protein [Clostridium mobile]
MNDFEIFINKILENSGINDHDKEELKFEFYDHLMLLKEEYIEKGYCEREAISRSISDFGMHGIAEIKDSLPSKNKYSSFSIRHKVKCLINMFFVYVIFIYLDSLLFSNTPAPMVSNGI